MSEELKPHVVKSHDIRLDSDYVSWVHDVKQRYVSAQIKSAVKVNTEQLSLDLQNEFPKAKGFSARNLWNMKNGIYSIPKMKVFQNLHIVWRKVSI